MSVSEKSTKAEILKAYLEKEAEMVAFKKKVVEVAHKYAEEYDWCSVVDNALDDMGIKVTGTVVLTVEITLTGTSAGDVGAKLDIDFDNVATGLNNYDFATLIQEECPDIWVRSATFEVSD